MYNFEVQNIQSYETEPYKKAYSLNFMTNPSK